MTIYNAQMNGPGSTWGACDCGDHVFAPVGNGFITLVSPEDAHLLNKPWHSRVRASDGYVTVQRTEYSPKRTVTLARVIVQPKQGEQADHINRDPLDNRRINLRPCTPAENTWNRSHPKRRLPVGVSKVNRKFVARIRADGKPIHLGYFFTPDEAHRAYLKAVAIHHRIPVRA